jgi:hypothetical protein
MHDQSGTPKPFVDGLQVALSVGGIIAMIVSATLLNLISIKPRQPSARNSSLLSEDQATATMSQSARR